MASCLFRVSTLQSPLVVFRPEHYLPGFRPSSRYHQAASTQRAGSQTHTTFRPQAFAASRRLTPPLDSPAYFIRQPSPGFIPFRGFSPRAATLTRREQLPPCRCPPSAQRPRAMAAVGLLDYEVFIRARKRLAGLVLSAPLFAPLIGLVLLQVPPLVLRFSYPKRSVHAVIRTPFTSPRRAHHASSTSTYL